MPPISPVTSQGEATTVADTLKSDAAGIPQTSAVSPPTQQCQICFDDIEESPVTQEDATAATAATTSAVTRFCSDACPAVLCRTCTAEHVRISVASAFPGVLPKVRCPICLVQVSKVKWRDLVSEEVNTKYVELCRTSCSFRTPCCENTLYTHLPNAVGEAGYRPRPELELKPNVATTLDVLLEQTRRFCAYEIAPKDLVVFLEDRFGRYVNEEFQTRILEHVLPTIVDEERRATLLLAYHAKHKVVKTRCCAHRVCFNCKRKMSSHPTGNANACETSELHASYIVECRSCHVTMVKVEGCSSVRCWCGFTMSWTDEVTLRDRYKKGLIPVDIFDIKLHLLWKAWQQQLTRVVVGKLLAQKQVIRRRCIDQQLSSIDGLRETLRKLVQRPYIWRARFARGLVKMQEEMARVRMRLLANRLKTHESFLEAVRRAVWRGRFKRGLPKMQDEMVRVRMKILARRLIKHQAFVVAVGRLKWRGRFKRSMPKMLVELRHVCSRRLAATLKQHGAFAEAVGRAKWRRRFTRALPQLEKELSEHRMARCVAKLRKSASFKEALRKAKWRARWTRVVKSIHAKRFWISYESEHPEEQRALRDEELALLLPGFR